MTVSDYSVVIVDDEPLAREHLRSLIEEIDGFEILGECRDGREAVSAIRRLKPDIVLLDIQLPELSGMEVVRELYDTDTPLIIFVTAYDKYALKAFDIHALDYLLKPFSQERFYEALGRARDQLQLGKQSYVREDITRLINTYNELVQPNAVAANPSVAAEHSPIERLERIPVRQGGKVVLVETRNIVWIEALDYYVQLHCGERTHLIRESMKWLEERLDKSVFVRIHRSAIVNLNFIRELRPLAGGDHDVILSDHTKLKLSRRRKDHLEKVLGRKF